MSQTQDSHSSVENPAAERFYSGAASRILRFTGTLALVLAIPCWLRFGVTPTAGFLLGGLVSWLNFYWLSEAVRGLADRIVDVQSREKGAAIVLRFFLRYLLIGLVAYVIFKSWPAALTGFLSGLCLPAGALILEAGYEAFVAIRRGL